MKEEQRCKGCDKVITVGHWCTACYYEYHESKEDLMRDYDDEEMAEKGDPDDE